MRNVDTDYYVRELRYDRSSVDPPALNCWGLLLLAMRREGGSDVDLPSYEECSTPLRQVRAMRREERSGAWALVPHGGERPLDAVLMRGLVGQGATAKLVELHCGVVVRPGFVMDVEEGNGVLVRAFRTVGGERAHPGVSTRVMGVYRWRGLAHAH